MTSVIGEPLQAITSEQQGSDWGLSTLLCVVVVTICCIANPGVLHWFLIPVFISGVIIATDAIAWMRGRIDIFDPIGIVGLIGIHFFFIAPLLHVTWDAFGTFRLPMSTLEWKNWLGAMAMLNLLGLIIYRVTRYWMLRKVLHYRGVVEPAPIFWPLLIFALFITVIAQIGVYISYGGISGFVAAYEQSRREFLGMGWIFMVSESFPILLLIGWAVYVKNSGKVPTWVTIFFVLLVFLALKLLFGGLRGSRSNTVWGLFWAVGIIHYLVRAFPRKWIYAGIAFVVMFMYIYGFYKAAGVQGLEAVTNTSSRERLEGHSGRTLEAVLLGDLARADVQAYLLKRVTDPQSGYELAWGKTFVGTLSLFVPRQIWPDRPPGKWYYGTLAQGSSESRRSSRVYGLAGEWMLNFGVLGVPCGFLLLAIFVCYARRYMLSLYPGDIRYVLVPFLANLCIVALSSDSDNIFYFIVKNGVVPILLLWLGMRKIQYQGDRSGSQAGKPVFRAFEDMVEAS